MIPSKTAAKEIVLWMLGYEKIDWANALQSRIAAALAEKEIEIERLRKIAESYRGTVTRLGHTFGCTCDHQDCVTRREALCDYK